MTIERVNSINTTNTRILLSQITAVILVSLVTIAVLFFGWEPTKIQERVLIGVAAVLLTMMGFDVAQFIGKRFSDAGYAAAKNPNQPVVTAIAPEKNGDTAPEPGPVLTQADAKRAAITLDGGEKGAE